MDYERKKLVEFSKLAGISEHDFMRLVNVGVIEKMEVNHGNSFQVTRMLDGKNRSTKDGFIALGSKIKKIEEMQIDCSLVDNMKAGMVSFNTARAYLGCKVIDLIEIVNSGVVFVARGNGTPFHWWLFNPKDLMEIK